MKTSPLHLLRFLNLLCAMALASVSVRAADASSSPTPNPSAVPAGGGAAGFGPGGAGGRGGAGLGGAAGRGGFGGGGARGGLAQIVVGPPAPVPPQVAIPRPTAAELAQVNEAVKKFAASDSSGIKPLLDRFPGLIAVQPPRANVAATFTQTQQRVGARHAGFVALAKQGGIDLLFEGDSITDWWFDQTTHEPTAAFAKYFGGMKVADFAIAGDTTQGVLWGLHNGEGQGFSPKAIMLMIGTNNTGSNTPAEIAEGIGAIILENRQDFPNAKILLLAVFPRDTPAHANRLKIAEINKLIAKLVDHQHVFFLDIGAKFLDPATGVFLPDAFRGDNLHPQEKGYAIWGEAVKDILADFMK